MGLATIDPHSHKVQTKLYKILKFGVNRPNSKQETTISKCQFLQRMLSEESVRMAILSLLIFDVFKSLCLKQNQPD